MLGQRQRVWPEIDLALVRRRVCSCCGYNQEIMDKMHEQMTKEQDLIIFTFFIYLPVSVPESE